MKAFLDKIPVLLSSRVSIFIFLFLFFYLFIFGIVGLILPHLAPSATMQLVLGNYTNVTSALGAAIAAGAATQVSSQTEKIHKRHDHLEKSLADLHTKIDKLSKIKESSHTNKDGQ